MLTSLGFKIVKMWVKHKILNILRMYVPVCNTLYLALKCSNMYTKYTGLHCFTYSQACIQVWLNSCIDRSLKFKCAQLSSILYMLFNKFDPSSWYTCKDSPKPWQQLNNLIGILAFFCRVLYKHILYGKEIRKSLNVQEIKLLEVHMWSDLIWKIENINFSQMFTSDIKLFTIQNSSALQWAWF